MTSKVITLLVIRIVNISILLFSIPEKRIPIGVSPPNTKLYMLITILLYLSLELSCISEFAVVQKQILKNPPNKKEFYLI